MRLHTSAASVPARKYLLPSVLASNRDEYFARPSEAARWRNYGSTQILSGLDTVGHGTWLGISRTGRFALLTNFTEPTLPALLPDGSARPSRGNLVTDFLTSSQSVEEHSAGLRGQLSDYAGFNLLLGQLPAGPFAVVSNRPAPSLHAIQEAIHGGEELKLGAISNGHFKPSSDFVDGQTSEAWQKVKSGAKQFQKVIDSPSSSKMEEELCQLMR